MQQPDDRGILLARIEALEKQLVEMWDALHILTDKLDCFDKDLSTLWWGSRKSSSSRNEDMNGGGSEDTQILPPTPPSSPVGPVDSLLFPVRQRTPSSSPPHPAHLPLSPVRPTSPLLTLPEVIDLTASDETMENEQSNDSILDDADWWRW